MNGEQVNGEHSPSRAAKERALALAENSLALAEEIVRTLRADLAAEPDPFVPLVIAAREMGMSKEAAKKRAQRGDGVRVDGRLGFTRSYVERYRPSANVPGMSPLR